MKKLLLTIFLLIVLPWEAWAVNSSMPTIKNPFDDLQVSVPGMKRFTDVVITANGEGRFTIVVNWLAEYIVGWYNYLIGIVGLVAVLIIAYGGVLWLLSAGNSSKISKAQGIIKDAVLGLVLALGSYSLLYIINRDLVNFKGVQLNYVNKQAVDFVNNIPLIDDGSETDDSSDIDPGVDPINPADLVPMTAASMGVSNVTADDRRITRQLAEALQPVIQAAKQQGLKLTITSGYRTLAAQTNLWNEAVKKYGKANASKKVAYPSYRAPHLRGVAIDIKPSDNTHANRVKMHQLFKAAGWYQYCGEYWHFQPSWARPKQPCTPGTNVDNG